MAYTTINKSSEHFNTKLYTGTGSSQSITGVGHQPDFVWVKQRSGTQFHQLANVIQGVGKQVCSNADEAESTDANGLTAFGTDGFSVGSSGNYNNNGGTFASWNWKANGVGSANTAGSINSTVSVNTTSGFSIIKYTGNGTNNATIGHGLGVAPKILIGKCTGTVSNWQVVGNFGSLTEGKYLILNEPNAIGTSSNVSFDASATTVKFQGGQGLNISGQPHIAYCFAEKTGYSKFGSYTGNGNADGSFIYTGFKPAFILQKRTDSTSNWHIFDIKRDTYNLMNKYLAPNDSGAESTAGGWDFLSNGFKVRSADNWQNQSGGTYIYMAFAAAPLVGTNNVPCTAR